LWTGVFAVLLLASSGIPPAGAGAGTATGTVDRTFGTSGTALSPNIPLSSVEATTRDAQGRVLAATNLDGTLDIVLFRFLANGQLDPSFGLGGRVTIHDPSIVAASGVATYPDGRVAVVLDGIPTSIQVARLLANGHLDPSFGYRGITTPTPGFGGGIAVDHAGRVVVGVANQDRPGMLRYTSAGTLDQSFGFHGRGNVLSTGNGYIGAIAIDAADGVFLVGADQNTARVEHLTNRGQRDPHFGTNGDVSIPELIQLNTIGLATNGDVVAAGSYPSVGSRPPAAAAAVVRVHASGTRDVAYGHNGVALVPGLFQMFPTALSLAADGSVVIGGTSPVVGLTELLPYATLLRLLPDGRVDTAFGCGGQTWMRFGLDASSDLEAPIGVFGEAGSVLVVGQASSVNSGTRIALQRVQVTQAPPRAGYWLATSDGSVEAFGRAAPCASLAYSGAGRVVGVAGTTSGRGYWQVASDGGVFSFGDAQFYGSAGNLPLHQAIVGAAATPTGHGYWLVASDGGVFTYGDAHFYGSTGRIRLNQPIVGMQPTPTGHGYWLVASDGGVFTYGDAHFYGSTGSIRLNKPVVGMTASP
jgi:uncharacterized delta-60 repeat protein